MKSSERPQFINKYLLDWDLINVVVGGQSALDTRFFVAGISDEQVLNFLKGYGFDPNDPVSKAELFGNFQEALQFIRRFCLKEGNPDGVDLKIPNSIFMITDINQLFFMAAGNNAKVSLEERLWAEIILKVMHTVVHIDKDLRANYFPVIQTQVFDRFYKYIFRDEKNVLYIGIKGTDNVIQLVDFQTKAKKTRESVIIKLLHKAENVAEELFDRIGIRIVTENKFDTLRVVKFLLEQSIVIPHNIKPSRSINTLIDIKSLKKNYVSLLKEILKNNLTEQQVYEKLQQACMLSVISETNSANEHSSQSYQSIQFTCRQLIKYRNSFLSEFNNLRQMAKKADVHDELAKKILSLDLSLVARDIRFFYPYEVQIVDRESHDCNTKGEASHQEYKKSQLRSAIRRIFCTLLEYKKIEF